MNRNINNYLINGIFMTFLIGILIGLFVLIGYFKDLVVINGGIWENLDPVAYNKYELGLK